MSEPFRAGEQCLLLDPKGRRYLLTLRSQGSFSYHRGTLAHSEIIGREEGVLLASTGGERLVTLRPRLADYVLKMSRGATVLYPKDIGALLVWADIGPGAVVVEAGTGSGALAMALVRAVGSAGRVVSVERREDHAALAMARIQAWFGEIPFNLELRIGEVAEVAPEVQPDRLVLDIPEPFGVVEVAAGKGLQSGGVFCSYVPTVPQMAQTAAALDLAGCFVDLLHFEVLHREWVANGRSVRPSQQMVGHTGFLTVARKTAGTSSVKTPD